MEETKDRLICFFTMPEKFFTLVELNYMECSLWAAAVTFLHALAVLLIGGGDLNSLFVLPLIMLIVLLVYSFAAFAILKTFIPQVEYGVIYEIISYAYFMMSSIHLLIYLLLWLPRKFALLVVLVAFGGLFFAAYLSVKAICNRYKQKPLYVFGALLAAFIICFLLNTKTNVIDTSIFFRLKG